jgi:hypothetical protein
MAFDGDLDGDPDVQHGLRRGRADRKLARRDRDWPASDIQPDDCSHGKPDCNGGSQPDSHIDGNAHADTDTDGGAGGICAVHRTLW